jgi:diguanylate cyclase (GGDEF)-like protein
MPEVAEHAERPRLLVVAPAATREPLRAALAASGHELVETAEPATALGLLRGCGFDLVLVDADLPAAMTLCDEVARLGGAALVVLAAAEDAANQMRAPRGCDLVPKPASAPLVVRGVERALERRTLTRAVEESRGRLARAQRLARLGGFEVDWSRRIVRCSDEARAIFGLAETATSFALDELRALVGVEERARWGTWLESVANGAAERPFEHHLFRPDQTERIVRVQAERQVDAVDGRVRLLALVHDVTDRRRVEEELEYQAHHDELTGLANRRQLVETVEHAIERSRANSTAVAVFFLDLDRFKDFNETLGQRTGDQLLQRVANRLRDCVRDGESSERVPGRRPTDWVARPGGDEFAVVVEGVRRREDAQAVVRRLLEAFARPFRVDERELWLTASVGAALCPDDSSDVATLLRQAETAMHHAKERGRSSAAFFEAGMNHAAELRLAFEGALRHALERHEIEVWYQPRVDLSRSRIVAMEALARWRRPDVGLVLPDEFVPVAEQTGLIAPIGAFVMREACAQTRRWREAGFDVGVAVNLSGEQFRDAALPEAVASLLQDVGLAPHLLELELTESILMRDVERTLQLLGRLAQKGVQIAVDDFGTGYSSLSYLKRFPIDCLKIDKSFVVDVTRSSRDAALTNSIVVMAHSLGLATVAEGVESEEQARFLTQQKCDQGQGYHFSEPLPAPAATKLLEKQLVQPSQV